MVQIFYPGQKMDWRSISMKLQQQVLELYQNYHVSPPSLVGLIGRNLGRYLLMIITAALAIILFYSVQLPNHASVLLGLLIGALLRDIAVFQRLIKTWPITESVLDWDRIDTLLEE
jgi:hypothetical protein